MSWLSKTAKKIERSVSKTAYKAGIGKDLHKAANIFGAANVGGAVGVVTGFLTGGAPGAVYGGVTGGVTAAYQKSKGASSSKYISNAAGTGAIAGSIGPLIYKPAATAVITAPGPVSGYGATTTVRTAAGSPIGNLFGGASNVLKDAVSYIGKGGLTALASETLGNIFGKKPSGAVNPDYLEGNAVAPGQTFPQWLTGILPGRSENPNAPSGSYGGDVVVNPGDQGGTVIESGGPGQMNPLLLAGLVTGGAFLGYKFLAKRA